MEKGNPSTLSVGMTKGAATVKTIWKFFKKLKLELPYDPTILFLGIQLHKNLNKRDTLSKKEPYVHIAKAWEQPKCLPTDEWIKKIWYIYTMEYYSAIKGMK